MSIKKYVLYWLSIMFLLTLSGVGFGETLVGVNLADIDSGLTSPSGNYRWMDSADQVYAYSYQISYNYTQASVHIDYYTKTPMLHGTLTAANMKPNFTYQLKLIGDSEEDFGSNESLGLTGRWWQEIWGWHDIYGGIWMNGGNLNNKGDGSSPNPNDEVYYAHRDIEDLSSPTGLHYRYSAYRVLDYFITDANGDASFDFVADSSYHVIFKTSQRSPDDVNDGHVVSSTFDADISSTAYDTDYGEQTVGIFGEWERLPMGGLNLIAGTYNVKFLLTEESFHGSGLAGGWAAAMAGDAAFTICPYDLAGDLNEDCKVDMLDFAVIAENWLIDCIANPSNPACVPK
ncbi:MAG: hypothetical protein JXB29_04315 [Sedimentisphaerales bacterium]|nr:hypothetical protein [Sedimentisphaerales bacterium]